MRAANFQPTAKLWGALIIASSQGSLENSFAVWREMKQQGGGVASIESLEAIMNACVGAYQGERALQLLRQAQAEGPSHPPPPKHTRPFYTPNPQPPPRSLHLASRVANSSKVILTTVERQVYFLRLTPCHHKSHLRERSLQTFQIMAPSRSVGEDGSKTCNSLRTTVRRGGPCLQGQS